MMKKKMPKIHNEEEFAIFIESHDLANFWDEFEDVEAEIDVPRPTKKPITMRIYPYLLKGIKKIARKRGVPYQSLIQQWLAEKLDEEKKSA